MRVWFTIFYYIQESIYLSNTDIFDQYLYKCSHAIGIQFLH